MEALFAQAYTLLPAKIAVGCFLALAVPPAGVIGRPFYSIGAAISFLLACVVVAATIRVRELLSPVAFAGVLTWSAFSVSLACYYRSLFSSSPSFRARTFPVALGLGMLALSLSTFDLLSSRAVPARLILSLLPWTGAALSGAALGSMLLGHFYLVDQGLDPAILERMRRYCRACLVVEATLVPVCFTVALVAGAIGPARARGSLLPLLAGRALTWGATATLLALIGKTLKVPQPMAATGLFYICSLSVLVGEICGHWLLFRTGLPL